MFHVTSAGLLLSKGCNSPLSLPVQGPVHAATTIFKEEGLLGLWSGAAPTVMRNGTNQMCLFWAKNNFDGLLWGKQVRHLLTGCIRWYVKHDLWSQCENLPCRKVMDGS